MASVKKGILVPSPQWWKHLRSWKRIFWKKHRKVEKRETRTILNHRRSENEGT
jgi:hypothetical protein